MSADILIVGQGLAGSLLGWELERAGIAFAIADPGHETAASAAAAGIVNPITGRRLVKSWNIETLLPLARETYSEIGDALGVPLWRPMRVRRIFADARERAAFAAKHAAGALAPHVREADETGCWIEDAARVDLGGLLAGLRMRWAARGWLRTEAVDLPLARARHGIVIECSGAAGARRSEFAFVPWEFAKGEVLEIAVEGLDGDVILNRRQWIAPVGDGAAWVGATHEPGVTDRKPTAAARTLLEASARELLGGRSFEVTRQRAGVRVTLPDKRPVVGRHPDDPRLGLINGLGAKGALLAPWLARQWVAHLQTTAAFAPEVDVRRFG